MNDLPHIDPAPEFSDERTQKPMGSKAFCEFIAPRERQRLIDLLGKLEWDEGFDYKAERSRY